MGGWVAGWLGGWVAGSIETKAISASNLMLKLKLTEAELGNISFYRKYFLVILIKRSQLIFCHNNESSQNE